MWKVRSLRDGKAWTPSGATITNEGQEVIKGNVGKGLSDLSNENTNRLAKSVLAIFNVINTHCVKIVLQKVESILWDYAVVELPVTDTLNHRKQD